MTEETLLRPRTRLYLITPPRIADVTEFAATLEGALASGDVACLQLRLKTPDNIIDEAATRRVATEIKDMVQAYNTALIINDSPSLAADLDVDGVHVGATDLGVREARAIIGPDRILGATAKNSRHVAMLAGEAGADYVAFGAFYPTQTKQDTVHADPEILEIWQEMMELPCVAIGGITLDNAAPLVSAGADFIAVSSAVWNHAQGPAAAVARFNEILDALDPATQA